MHANRNYLSSTSSRQQFVHRICPHRRQCRRTFSSENRRPHCMHFSTVLFGTKKLRWYRFSLGRIRYASQLPPWSTLITSICFDSSGRITDTQGCSAKWFSCSATRMSLTALSLSGVVWFNRYTIN